MKNIDKKLSVQKSKQSEENLNLIFDNANDLISIYNDRFECEFINEKVLKRILGYTFEDIKGDKSFRTIHPDDIQKAKDIFTRTFKVGAGFGESRIRCKNGKFLWFQSKGKIFVKNGKKRLILISRDITEIKEARDKLIGNREKYKLILDNAPDLITIINENLQHEFINEKAYNKLLGYSREDIIERTPLTRLHPDDQEQAIKELMDCFLHDEGKYETRVMHKDGYYIWLENKGKTFIDADDKKKVLIISREITERKEIESKLKDQNVELEKLNELKSQFLRRATHELKTPLVSIKGYIELLLDLCKGQSNPDIILYLEQIREGSIRLEYLIQKIIENSKLESFKARLKTTKENLSALIKSSLRELKELSDSRNHSIGLNVKENLFLNIDKDQILEVLTNLLRNAIVYTPPNGIITIQTEVKNNYIIISIKDTGIGFTKKEKTQIFQQFGKINRSNFGLDLGIEGSGLGLYISKQIIELHGGEIWVKSEGRNKGSTFYISLPRKKNENPS
ncbi:MAG: PAS domain S-box protein [Candidatus Thorarchaeota archaeon]